LAQGVEEIITILHTNGVMVRNVVENNTVSQPWFTPRCPDYKIDDFDFRYFDGESYKLTGYIIDSAKFNAESTGKSKDDGRGIFSWDHVYSQFKAGTLHQGLKSAIGWLVLTTDWANSQIKQALVPIVENLCPNKEKVDRAINKGEIDKLIKYCREKTGTNVTTVTNWKDHLISADELKDKEFPPVKWAVDGIIPEGLTVLAGDPKAGKSLMAVDICCSVASGEECFGTQKCTRGDVVYISLEDPERRVKDRIKQQCDLWPETFHLVTGGIPQLGSEFYSNLDEMLLLWPELRAIIIDTMTFIVPPKPNGMSDYDHIYKQLDPLHKWALDNHIAVILITHKSKATRQNGDNPFAGIIGSVAVQGTADAMIMLERNHYKKDTKKKDKNIIPADGFLSITGREIEQNRFSLDFDSECMKWALRGKFSGGDVTGNPNHFLIIQELKKRPMSPKEIAAATMLNESTTRSALRRLSKNNEFLEKKEDKYYVVSYNYNTQDDW